MRCRILMETGGKLAGSPGTHALLHEYARYVHAQARDAFTVGEVYDSLGTMLTYYPDQLDVVFRVRGRRTASSPRCARGSSRGLLARSCDCSARCLTIVGRRSCAITINRAPARSSAGTWGRRERRRSLLLTLPGVPFVYYGEEIGMIGAKPDERLRTPMQWSRVARGWVHAWHAMGGASDRFVDDHRRSRTCDPTSLLDLYRRLIHLRSSMPALGEGELVPLTSSVDGVAAYLRRKGGQMAMVVVNLTSDSVRSVTLASDSGSHGARDMATARCDRNRQRQTHYR